MRTRITLLSWTGILLIVAQGCHRSPGALTPVTGRISYQGRPLTTGTIVFVPDISRGETGPAGYAKIRPDGTYVLQTTDGPGVPAGWYRITVTSLGPPGSTYNNPLPIPQSYIPDRYCDPDQSLLACEIKSSRPNNIDLNLD